MVALPRILGCLGLRLVLSVDVVACVVSTRRLYSISGLLSISSPNVVGIASATGTAARRLVLSLVGRFSFSSAAMALSFRRVASVSVRCCASVRVTPDVLLVFAVLGRFQVSLRSLNTGFAFVFDSASESEMSSCDGAARVVRVVRLAVFVDVVGFEAAIGAFEPMGGLLATLVRFGRGIVKYAFFAYPKNMYVSSF
jgi:hypothetical protein